MANKSIKSIEDLKNLFPVARPVVNSGDNKATLYSIADFPVDELKDKLGELDPQYTIGAGKFFAMFQLESHYCIIHGKIRYDVNQYSVSDATLIVSHLLKETSMKVIRSSTFILDTIARLTQSLATGHDETIDYLNDGLSESEILNIGTATTHAGAGTLTIKHAPPNSHGRLTPADGLPPNGTPPKIRFLP